MLKFEPNDPVFGFATSALPEGPYEIVDGQIVEKRTSLLSEMVANQMKTHLSYFAMTKNLGWFVSETLFDFVVKKNRRCPDLAFVSYSRWPRSRGFKTSEGWDVVPEIAVEVISPSNTVQDLDRKIDEYFGHGVSEVWIVNPEVKRLQRMTSLTKMEILTQGDTLTSEFLPGLALPLSEIFLEIEVPAEA